MKPKDVSYWLKNKGKHFLLYITSCDWLKWQYYKSAMWHSWEIVTVTRVYGTLGGERLNNSYVQLKGSVKKGH